MDQALEGVEENEMKLSERAQEILETLWISIVEEKKNTLSLGLAQREDGIRELDKNGYIQIAGGEVGLKDKGVKEGERIVRRHRLAERRRAGGQQSGQCLSL